MKTLPVEYWQHDYSEMPRYYQRYWIQRCLELLDAETRYTFGLDTINSATLVRDLVETSSIRYNRKEKGTNARTFHFLLHELYERLDSDTALEVFIDRSGLSSRDFRSAVSEGVRKSSLLFDPIGLRIGNTVGFTKEQFAGWLCEKGMAQGDDTGIIARVCSALKEDRQGWLRAHTDVLRDLLHRSNQYTRDAVLEESLDSVTRSWLFEMIVHDNCGPVHLSETFRSIFLRRRRASFAQRLERLFNALRTEQHDFTVFMRLQARKELGRIGTVEQVRFSVRCLEGHNIVQTLLGQGRMSPMEARRARDFFFDGEASKRLIFAVAQVEGGNIGSATRSSLQLLHSALDKAKFEYERSRLSIDNAVYAYDHDEDSLARFTRRQAQADRYIARGNTVQFESLIYRLDRLQSSPNSWVDASVLRQITDLALQWHRHAVESSPPEIRFMNHWIELEQLFKTAKSLGLTTASPGDTLVRALSRALVYREKRLLLQDLWGDLQRCNILGPKPYLLNHSGRVRFTESFIERLYSEEDRRADRSYRRWKGQEVDIEIWDKHRREPKPLKTYRIPPGFRVFAEDGQLVKTGTWIAGPDIGRLSEFKSLKPLFKNAIPGLANTLYLILHWDALSSLTEGQRSSLQDNEYYTLESLSHRDVLDYEETRRMADYLSREIQSNLDPNCMLINEREIDAALERVGWPAKGGLRARFKYVTNKLRDLRGKRVLAILNRLEEVGLWLRDNQSTPTAIWVELFRDREPDFWALEDLLLHHVDDLLRILPEQPLLQSRIHQVADTVRLGYQDNNFTSDPLVCYAATLDRMRRARNTLVHSGTVPEEISLLSRELYYYSRTYLKTIIHSLTKKREHNDAYLKAALFID